MVTIKEVRASNAQLSTSTPSPTALFVGATAGIGLATVQQLLCQTASPTIYLVGRSESTFAPKLNDLRAVNAKASITFIEAQISLLKDVERVANVVKGNESKLDLLFLSAGYLSFDAREETSEGLTKSMVVAYYERLLFTHLLLPLLNAAPAARVISVLGAGREGPINTTDFGLQSDANYSLLKSLGQQSSMMSLSLELLSKQNPKVVFVHDFPGMVDTGIQGKTLAGLKGWYAPIGFIASWILLPLMSLFAMTAETSGEWGLYKATGKTYAADGNGFYRLEVDGEECGANKMLEKYRDEELAEKVWEHSLAVFEKALA